MNVGVLRYRCDRCGQEYVVRQIQRYYELEDGSLLVRRLPAWCHAEKTMVEAEAIDDVEALERIVAMVEAEVEKSGGDHQTEFDNATTLDESRRRLRWRRTRRSPPRCLECGSTNVESVPESSDQGELRHPSCGGVLSLTAMDLEDLDSDPIRYDAEGIRLE
jgi:predicted nucleic acid-binding Zn ribbon protein